MLKLLMDLLLSSAMNMVIKSFILEEWRVEIGTTQFFKKNLVGYPVFWT